MKAIAKISPFLLVMVMLVWCGCSSTKKSKTAIPNYIGQWNYVLALPDGDFEGYVKFFQEEDQVIGIIGGRDGETNLTNLVITEESVSGDFDYMGYAVTLSGTFVEEVLNGKMAAEGYEFPFEAHKQQEQ